MGCFVYWPGKQRMGAHTASGLHRLTASHSAVRPSRFDDVLRRKVHPPIEIRNLTTLFALIDRAAPTFPSARTADTASSLVCACCLLLAPGLELALCIRNTVDVHDLCACSSLQFLFAHSPLLQVYRFGPLLLVQSFATPLGPRSCALIRSFSEAFHYRQHHLIASTAHRIAPHHVSSRLFAAPRCAYRLVAPTSLSSTCPPTFLTGWRAAAWPLTCPTRARAWHAPVIESQSVAYRPATHDPAAPRVLLQIPAAQAARAIGGFRLNLFSVPGQVAWLVNRRRQPFRLRSTPPRAVLDPNSPEPSPASSTAADGYLEPGISLFATFPSIFSTRTNNATGSLSGHGSSHPRTGTYARGR